MKRIIISGLLALAMLATGCANQTTPLTFQKFYRLGPTCDVTEFVDDTFVPNGNLDVAWGAPAYRVAYAIINTEAFTQPAVEVGAHVLETENRNFPLISRAVVTYRPSRPLGAALPEYIIPYTGIVGGNINGQLQLISPALGQALEDTLAPTTDRSDFVDINIDVHFEGEMSGSRTPVETGEITLPIRAYKSAPTFSCANGFKKYSVDPATNEVSCLYNGQTFNIASVPTPPFDSATQCCPPEGGPGC